MSKPSFSPSPRLTAAFEYARQLHEGQVRKGTTIPYPSHLMAVAALVLALRVEVEGAVASQDGRFTVFAWSEGDGTVEGYRVETLLL